MLFAGTCDYPLREPAKTFAMLKKTRLEVERFLPVILGGHARKWTRRRIEAGGELSASRHGQ